VVPRLVRILRLPIDPSPSGILLILMLFLMPPPDSQAVRQLPLTLRSSQNTPRHAAVWDMNCRSLVQVVVSLVDAVLSWRAWPIATQLLTMCTQGIHACATYGGQVADAGSLEVWCDLAAALLAGALHVSDTDPIHKQRMLNLTAAVRSLSPKCDVNMRTCEFVNTTVWSSADCVRGGMGRQITLWILRGGSRPPKDGFEVLGGGSRPPRECFEVLVWGYRPVTSIIDYWTVYCQQYIEQYIARLLLDCYIARLLLDCYIARLLLYCYIARLLLHCYIARLLLDCYIARLLLDCYIARLLLDCYIARLLIDCYIARLLLDCYIARLLIYCQNTV
jgi:hypothetical protein